MKKINNLKAFSLAELMIVMLILTIILAATMPILSKRAKVKAAAAAAANTVIPNATAGGLCTANTIGLSSDNTIIYTCQGGVWTKPPTAPASALPVVTEGTACTATTNNVGVDATYSSFFICQGGVWVKKSGGGAAGQALYIYGYSSSPPASCPSGWTQAGYGQIDNTSYPSSIRTCNNSNQTCSTMCLYGYSSSPPASCPSGWTQAGYGQSNNTSYPSLVRSCYKCS